MNGETKYNSLNKKIPNINIWMNWGIGGRRGAPCINLNQQPGTGHHRTRVHKGHTQERPGTGNTSTQSRSEEDVRR